MQNRSCRRIFQVYVVANLRSSKKDIRKIAKRREQNSQKKAALRTYSKNIVKLIKEGKKEDAARVFQSFTALLDKAAKTNLIHKNKAGRTKSRFALKINAIS